MKNKIKRPSMLLPIIVLINIVLSCCLCFDKYYLLPRRQLSFSFIECIGNNIIDACDILKISEDQLVPKDNERIYEFINPVLYEGIRLKKYLSLFANADYISGGGYSYKISKIDESLIKRINKTRKILTEDYGKPKVLMDNTCLDSIIDWKQEDGSVYLYEQWTVPCVIAESALKELPDFWSDVQKSKGMIEGTLSLKLYLVQDTHMMYIDYKINTEQFYS